MSWIVTGVSRTRPASTARTGPVSANDPGFASAIAVILFAFCFVFALFYQRFALRRDTRGAMTRAVG